MWTLYLFKINHVMKKLITKVIQILILKVLQYIIIQMNDSSDDEGQIMPDDYFEDADPEEFEERDSNLVLGPDGTLVPKKLIEESGTGMFIKMEKLVCERDATLHIKEEKKHTNFDDFYNDPPKKSTSYKKIIINKVNKIFGNSSSSNSITINEEDLKLAKRFAEYHYADDVEDLERIIIEEVQTKIRIKELESDPEKMISDELDNMYTGLSLSAKSRTLIATPYNRTRYDDDIFSVFPQEFYDRIISFTSLREIFTMRVLNKKIHEKVNNFFTSRNNITTYTFDSIEELEYLAKLTKQPIREDQKNKIVNIYTIAASIAETVKVLVYNSLGNNNIKNYSYRNIYLLFPRLTTIVMRIKYKYEVTSFMNSFSTDESYLRKYTYVIFICPENRGCMGRGCDYFDIRYSFDNLRPAKYALYHYNIPDSHYPVDPINPVGFTYFLK
jgi:hypothetical protein